MITLLYEIYKNKKSVGFIYITNCPDKDSAKLLDNTGDEGYKLNEIISVIYEDYDKFELLTIRSESESELINPIPDHKTTCIIPWNLVIDN